MLAVEEAIVTELEETKFSFEDMLRISGRFTKRYEFKMPFRGGYTVSDGGHVVLDVHKEVTYEGVSIGRFPWFVYVIFKGYFGRWKSNQGMVSIKKLGDNSLSLSLDAKRIGVVQYCNAPYPTISIKENGSLGFPYQLALACALYNLIYCD